LRGERHAEFLPAIPAQDYLQWRDLKRFHLQAWPDRSAETPRPISNV
jgi:hypothetical protein